jgi:hypothetical protein
MAQLALTSCRSAPSDQELVAEFRAHRAEYDTLVTMFRADSDLGRIAYTFTRPANFFSGAPLPSSAPLTTERWNHYRRLFDRLSLDDGIEGYDRKHLMYFWRYGEGMGAGLGGASKGLAFSDSMPADRAVDHGCTAPRDDCWRFRPIGAGWFILEEHHN